MDDIAQLGISVDSRQVKTATGDLGGIARAAGAAESAANKLTSAVASLGAAFAGLNLASTALQNMRDFSREVAGLQAVTRASAAEMEKLTEQAKLLGAATSFGAGEAAAAQKALAQAGLETNQVLSATANVLALAQAGQLGLAQSADLSANIMSQFNLTAQQTGMIADVLVKTGDKSTTSVTELGDAFKYAGPMAAAMGVSLDDTAAALGVISNSGIKASSAGTGLLGVFRQLSNVSNEAADVLQKYGVSLADVNISARGLTPVIELLASKNIEAGDAIKIFGSESVGAALALLKAGDGVRAFADDLRNAEGAAQSSAAIMSDNLDSAIKGVGSAFEGLILSAKGSDGALKDIANTTSGVINAVSGVNDQLVAAGKLSADAASGYATMAGTLGILASVLVGRVAGGLAETAAAKIADAAASRAAAVANANETASALALETRLKALAMQELATARIRGGDTVAATHAAAIATQRYNAAVVAADTAQKAASASAGVLSGALAFIGGPIGLITTLLTAGITAWALWGNSGESAVDRINAKLREKNRLQAAGGDMELAQLTGDLTAAQNELNKKLEERNRIALNYTMGARVKQLDAEIDATRRTIMYAQIEISERKNQQKAQQEALKATEQTTKAVVTQNTFLTEHQQKLAEVAALKKQFAEEEKAGNFDAETSASRRIALQEKIDAIMKRGASTRSAISKEERKAEQEREKALQEAIRYTEDFGNSVKRARDSALESAIRQADAVEELVERAKEEAKTYGMSAEELAKYSLEQAETAVKTARTAGIAKERIEQLEREVKARRELVGLTSSAARRDEAAEAKKATEQAAADMGKSVQGTLATAIKAGFESGNPVKGFAKSLYQQTKTAIINAIAEGMATRMAAGIMGGTASGAASANDMSGMMQSANSMYQMYQQGVGGYISGLGQSFSTSSLGQFFGLSDASGALTQAGADLTVTAGNFADSVNTFGGYATAAYDVFNSFKTGDGWGKAVGSTIGAVFGGAAGAMIGRTVGGFVDDAFGGGGGDKIGGFASTIAMDRLYTPSQADASLAKVVGGVTDSISALAKSLGVTAGGFNVGLGFDTDPQGKAGNRVSSRLLDSAGKVIYESINRQVEDAQAGVAVEAQRLALAAIKSSNLPEEFARAFGTVAIAEATDEQVASITAQLQAIKAVKDVFDTVGAAMSQLKGLGYEARESLVALAGGVENLTAGLANYYQNFYTDAERASAATEQLRKQFSDMGMTLPATREAFRQLVEAQDLTTEAGRRMYAQLIGLSGAVAEFATRTEEAARKAAEAAAAKAEADRRAFEETVRAAEEARRAYDDLVRDAQRTYESSVRDAFSALSAAVNAEKDAVNKSAQAVIDDYQRQISAQEKLAESARKSASSLQSVIDILSAGVRSIRGGMTVAAARSFISSSIAAGGVADAEQLKLAVDTIKAIDESQYSTREELDRVRGQAAGDMDVLQKITGKQLTEAMRQVTAAESAASSLKLMIEETVRSRDRQIAALDTMLQKQQETVNAALGIKDAVMSVKDAISALGGAIRSTPVLPPAPPPVPTAPTAPTAPVVTTPPVVTPPPAHTGAGAAPSGSKSVYSAINDIYQQVLSREADASGLIFYATQAMGGKSLDQIRAEIANSPEAKRIDGSHRTGLDRVPFDGYRAELHAGERVLTAQQADSSDKMVEDVSSMDGTIKRVYQVLDRVEQLFNDWNEGGLPPTRA